jgi:hypothetical protein
MEGAAMTDEVYTPARRGVTAWLGDVAGGAKDMARAALREAMRWDAYQWTVLALLTATFLLVALSYGGIRAELAALKEERSLSAQDQRGVSAEIGKQMSDMQSALMQAISDMKAGLSGDIAKIGTKLDAKPKSAAPSPKPARRPRAQ